jgi:hypothetical protein
MAEIGIGQSRTLLSSIGDAIERHVLQLDELAEPVSQYSVLWAHFVEPHRDRANPNLITGSMKDVAELSYTALVRLASAHSAVLRTRHACESAAASSASLGEDTLTVQASLFEFFCNAGAAVDLLGQAYCSSAGPNALLFAEVPVWGSPRWFYERRSEYVHQRVVPVFPVGDVLHFDIHNLTQDSAWNSAARTPQEVSWVVTELLRNLASGLARGWANLYGMVRDQNGLRAMGCHPVTPITSGTPAA